MPNALADLLEELKGVEPLPQVATRVMQLASTEDVVPRDLVDVIQIDAAITAKVLKLCNSALYGFKREIASLADAGNLLGTSTLVNLVLTSCTGRYFRDYGREDPQASMDLWEQSIATAFASSLIATRAVGADRNRAYTVGLLENLGRLVMVRFLPEHSPAIETAVSGGTDRLAAEAAVLGLHHAEIGARLAERWDFPTPLVDSIRHHHTPESSQIDPLMASVGHVAELAIAHFGLGRGTQEPRYALHVGALGHIGLGSDNLEPLREPIEAEIAKAKRILEIA